MFKTTGGEHDGLARLNSQGPAITLDLYPDYPALLLEIPDPPPYLYVYGCISSTQQNISIVGSRNATQYGLETTQRLGRDLASLGLTIVSGMARGIDTAAHEGALMAHGKTIAVLGSGFDKIYPRENEKLFHRIAETGAVISEFPLNAEPEAHHFPMRNRVISGLSLGTVVVEATLRSGSLITARLAAEQNREVFAVPGSVNSFKSTGTHTLIKQGAKLVEQAGDIMDEISQWIDPSVPEDSSLLDGNTVPKPALSPVETSVLHALDHYPLLIDDLTGLIDVRSPLELCPHDRDPHGRRRAHPTNMSRAGNGRLNWESDQTFHLFGGQSMRVGHDRDGRRCEIREDIDGHCGGRVAARRGNFAQLQLDGREEGFGGRGFNILVLDADQQLIEVAWFDTHMGLPGVIMQTGMLPLPPNHPTTEVH